MRVSGDDALAVIPELSRIWDEPFADSSQIPTLLLSRLTRRHVTVSLSGDGADELFAGYHRYFRANRLLGFQRFPRGVRQVMNWGMALAESLIRRSIAGISPLARRMGDGLRRVGEILDAQDADDLYRRLNQYWPAPAALVIGGCEPITNRRFLTSSAESGIRDFQTIDLGTYLPDDLMVKVDRAAMAVSLECRAPFLDHRVVEFARTLPQEILVRGGAGKQVLRQVLTRYVPSALFDRRKMGFGIPIHDWLRGPLRSWAEDLLSEERLRREGVLHPEAIRQSWDEHQRGHRNWGYRLWGVLMFQAWWQEQQRQEQQRTA
jgi:asparagine synthase (glutamine-hydrolysing)